MSKHVFIFCNDFSGTGDGTFLFPELKFWSEKADRILLVPARDSSDRMDLSGVPSDKMEVFSLDMPTDWKVSFPKFLYWFGYLLFQKSFYSECRDLLRISPKLSSFYCLVSKYAYFRQAMKKMQQYLAQHPVNGDDTVILYSYWLDYFAGLAAKLNLPAKQITRISRAHGYEVYEYQKMNGYMPWRRRWLSGLDHVYTVSADGAAHLQNRYPAFRDKISHRYLGIQPFSVQAYRHSAEIRILSCSYAVPVKRVKLIAQALAQITDIPVLWTHLGGGPQLDSVRKAAEHLPENIRAVFPGHCTHDMVRCFYEENCVDLLVNVSESEGIPVSMMEALSAGIPVAGTAVGGVPEMIHEDENGWLLNAADPVPDLVKVIHQYASLPEGKRLEMRQDCRASWEKDFNAEKNLKEFVALLNGDKV